MIHIASAGVADLDSLIDLEDRLFPVDRLSSRQLRYLLTKANGFVLKAEQQRRLVGTMVLLKRKRSGKLRIYSLGVAQEARKQGIARELLRHAETTASACGCSMLTLEVCEHNQAAIKLYRMSGFSPVGRKDNYYEDGCTALQMKKTLNLEDVQ